MDEKSGFLVLFHEWSEWQSRLRLINLSRQKIEIILFNWSEWKIMRLRVTSEFWVQREVEMFLELRCVYYKCHSRKLSKWWISDGVEILKDWIFTSPPQISFQCLMMIIDFSAQPLMLKKILTKNHTQISGQCEIVSFFIPNTLYFLHFCIRVWSFEGRATQAQPNHQIHQIIVFLNIVTYVIFFKSDSHS